MKTYLYADTGMEKVPRLLKYGPENFRTRAGKPSVVRIKRWWPLCILVVLFFYSGPFLRWVDPTAAVVDVGALSLPLLGGLAGLAFVEISRWLLGLLWPVYREFGRHHFEPIFKSLVPWQKIVIYLVCYFLLLFTLVACLWAVY